jgi:hypothetical protein
LRFGQCHIDAIHLQVDDVQALVQQWGEAPVQMRADDLYVDACAIVITQRRDIEWSDKTAFRLLHVKRAMSDALGLRKRKAQAGSRA